MRYSLARGWLVFTAAITGLSLLQAIVLPRWPRLNANGLERFNWPAGGLTPPQLLLPGQRTADLARSST